jgi:hypothetical protein
MSMLYAEPRDVQNLSDCYFYHTIDLPGYGLMQGEWDLRQREPDYLGHVPLKDKSVLELGTANGYLCFWMEKQGANVTAYDLSKAQDWDIVPYANGQYEAQKSLRKRHIDRINNAFWFTHRIFKSKAKMVYGTVYEMPDEIGEFDIATFGCILVHLRDPFLALQRAASHIRHTIVITDRPNVTGKEYNDSGIRFLPNAAAGQPVEAWWELSPQLLTEFIQILGFTKTSLTYHVGSNVGQQSHLFTLVGQRL